MKGETGKLRALAIDKKKFRLPALVQRLGKPVLAAGIVYHSDSKEARESKLIRVASSQICFSLKLVISVLKHWYFFTTTAPPLSFFSLSLHTIHSVLNTSVKVSGGAHHYLSRKLC